MNLSYSSLLVAGVLACGSASAKNLDKFGRDITSPEIQLKEKVEKSRTLKATKNQAAFTEIVSSKANAADFVLGESYRPGQTSIGSVEFGDIDGDGDQELIAVSDFYFDEENDYSVFIFHPTENGLGTPTKVSYDATANRNGLSLTDLNQDGKKEIVVGHRQGMTIIESDGLGGFNKQIVSSSAADTLDSLDIDRDGNLDLIGMPWSAPANLYFGDGTGNISTISSLNTNASGYNDQLVTDLNNDGFDDFIAMSGQSSGPDFSIHYHNGVDALGSPEEYYLENNDPADGIGAGDLNGDGLKDIVVSRGRNSPTHLWVYTQTADGSFAPAVQLPSHDIPQTVRVSDINGDGFDDIIVLHGGWTTMGVYLNDENGLGEEIRVSIPYASHYGPEGLALGDLDNDGCNETFAIADSNNGVVPVTHNLCPEGPSITEEFSGSTSSMKVISFNTEASGLIDMTLTFDNSITNLDLYLFDSNKQMIYQSTTLEGVEQITTDELPAGKYYAKLINRYRKLVSYELTIKHD